MRKLIAGLSAGVLALAAAAGAQAQDTVKIGLIMSYSGQFADAATQRTAGCAMRRASLTRPTGGFHPSPTNSVSIGIRSGM